METQTTMEIALTEELSLMVDRLSAEIAELKKQDDDLCTAISELRNQKSRIERKINSMGALISSIKNTQKNL